MLGFIAFPGEHRGPKDAAKDPLTRWLDQLPANYDVFHEIETSEGPMEHLVASYDRGVFLIETCSLPGRVTVEAGRLHIDGIPADPNVAEATVRKAGWLRRVLAEGTGVTVPVTPIVVFTAAVIHHEGHVGSLLLTDLEDLGSALTHARGRGTVDATRFWEHRQCLAALA